jgi:hypothetical protein
MSRNAKKSSVLSMVSGGANPAPNQNAPLNYGGAYQAPASAVPGNQSPASRAIQKAGAPVSTKKK